MHKHEKEDRGLILLIHKGPRPYKGLKQTYQAWHIIDNIVIDSGLNSVYNIDITKREENMLTDFIGLTSIFATCYILLLIAQFAWHIIDKKIIDLSPNSVYNIGITNKVRTMQPFEVTYSYHNNKAQNHRPTKMELETRTSTIWATSQTKAKQMVKNRLGNVSVINITPKWS